MFSQRSFSGVFEKIDCMNFFFLAGDFARRVMKCNMCQSQRKRFAKSETWAKNCSMSQDKCSWFSLTTNTDVCWRWRMLTCANTRRERRNAAWARTSVLDFCWQRMLTYADVCWRMLTCANTRRERRTAAWARTSVLDFRWQRMLTYADFFWYETWARNCSMSQDTCSDCPR